MLKHVLVAAILFLSPVSASASMYQCWPDHDTEYPKLLEADAVFLGEMTDYRLVFGDGSNSLYPDAVMTFDVIETLKADLSDEVEITWQDPKIPPEDARPPMGVEIFAILALNDETAPSGKRYHAMETTCGGLLRFEGTAQNIEAIKMWLATGEVRAHELSSNARFGGPLTGTRPDDRFYWILMAFIALGAAIAITLTIKRLPKIA